MSARSFLLPRLSTPFTLFLLLLGALWLAGGASRGDVAGQVVVRTAAWLILVFAILSGVRPMTIRTQPAFWFLLMIVLLVLLQLVPLPPSIWTMLPGREPFLNAPVDQALWRPLSIVPWATINAVSSLIVPVLTLYLVCAFSDKEAKWLPTILLGSIFLAMLIGLFQFSGVAVSNPFIPDITGVSGPFANRNHFALLLAMGCIITPVWALSGTQRSAWRSPVALALVTLFTLTILATGSRVGILIGLLALIIGLALSWQNIRLALNRAPRWVFPVVIASTIGILAIFILISIAADRAESIRRALEMDPGQDMRARGLPTVLEMIAIYFPAGKGFGGFDPIFRLHEPFELLKRTYFNHAHNDFLEIVLDGGLPALIIMLAALGWYIFSSLRAWRSNGQQYMLPKLGSAMLLLLFVASAFDYPARTPMMLMLIVVSTIWLNQYKFSPTLPN